MRIRNAITKGLIATAAPGIVTATGVDTAQAPRPRQTTAGPNGLAALNLDAGLDPIVNLPTT